MAAITRQSYVYDALVDIRVKQIVLFSKINSEAATRVLKRLFTRFFVESPRKIFSWEKLA